MAVSRVSSPNLLPWPPPSRLRSPVTPSRSTSADSASAVITTSSAVSTADAEQPLDQVIVTGTRRAERTVLQSNVPIDVVSNEDLRKTSTADLNGKLQALVPSYNVRRIPTADGSIFGKTGDVK